MPSSHPSEFYAPAWHFTRTPVVDDKYYDRATGEIRNALEGDPQRYMGPPAVDISIRSQHINTIQCAYRAARALPMETLLCQVMKVVGEKKIELDSLMATTYSIRVILSQEITVAEFNEIASAMAQGI